MDPANVTIWLAALAGLASILSPCVLALLPAYIGYLGGRSVTPGGQVVENRWVTFSHGLAFVIGFSVIFIALGAAASYIGSLLYDLRTTIAKIGGVVVVIFGLHTIGIINIPFLDYDIRRHERPDPGLGYLSSALMGVFFSAGWAPCVGPVLGAVLTLALNSANLRLGIILMAAYSAGLAIPFLLTALGIGRMTELLRSRQRLVHYISIGTGLLLIAVGVMLFFGVMQQLVDFGFFIDLGL
jgi:cytochrome c-type biogenesis protein